VVAVALLTGAVALVGLATVWWLTAYVWGREVAATVFALVLLLAWSAVHLWRRAHSDRSLSG
jgi:positive regulator of sigma E activity